MRSPTSHSSVLRRFDHRLIAQPEPLPLLDCNSFGQLSWRRCRGFNLSLRRIVPAQGRIHQPFQLPVVFGESLKFVDGGTQGLASSPVLHLFGGGAKVRLKVNDWLGRPNQFVDLPTKKRRSLMISSGLAARSPFLNGDVCWPAALQELGDFFLRLAASSASFGDSLPKNARINGFMQRHAMLLPSWVRALRGVLPSYDPSARVPKRLPSIHYDSALTVQSRLLAIDPAPRFRC